MSWIRIAADLLRDAMSSSPTTEPVQEPVPPPVDIAGVTSLIAQHRVEIDRNLTTIVDMINTQNARQMRAAAIQRKWNYAFTAAIVVLLVLWAIVFWRM